MQDDPPKYVPPPPDPALAILTQQNQVQQNAVIQDRVTQASARLMTSYGTRTAMQAGGINWSPLMPQGAAAPPSLAFVPTGDGNF
jgi:hypothetical protein